MKDRWKKNTVKLAAGALAFGLGAAAPVTALAGDSGSGALPNRCEHGPGSLRMAENR